MKDERRRERRSINIRSFSLAVQFAILKDFLSLISVQFLFSFDCEISSIGEIRMPLNS